MPGNFRWTTEEDHILRRTYRRFGSRAVAVAIERDLGRVRTPRAIACHARDLGVHVDPTGRGRVIPLVEVHPTNRGAWPSAHPDAIAAAEADGVLERGPVHPRPYLVPGDWADAYIRACADRLERERAITTRWWLTPQVAAEFGVATRSVASVSAPGRKPTGLLDRHVRLVESTLLRVPTHGRKIVWSDKRFYEPESVRREANAYRAARLRSDWYRRRARNRTLRKAA